MSVNVPREEAHTRTELEVKDICRILRVWGARLSRKRADTELNMREADVYEETKAPNRGFSSIFIERSRSYTHGEREENNQIVINLCV